MVGVLCCVVTPMALGSAMAQPQVEWSEPVESGDTLTGISRRFLREPLRWRSLQRHTGVRNVDVIAPDSLFRNQVQRMRSEPTTPSVVRVQGGATVPAAADTVP